MKTTLELRFEKTVYTSTNVRKISYLVNKKVADKLMVEELVSEIFLKAWKGFDTFNSELSSVNTWLSNIAKNTIIDFMRVKRNGFNSSTVKTDFLSKDDSSNEIDYSNSHSTKINPESIFEVAERIEAIKSIIGKIKNPKIQLVVNEHLLNDKKLKTICKEHNMPMGSVKVYIKNGVQFLQENINHKMILA